jgi:hypothetical protein
MRYALWMIVVGALSVGVADAAEARSRHGSNGKGTRYIHGNERFYETTINERVGRNASYAEKFFAYVRLSR